MVADRQDRRRSGETDFVGEATTGVDVEYRRDAPDPSVVNSECGIK
jgi:hypothetical protein